MRLRSAAKTHVGLVRENNEDSYLCDNKTGLYAVADGMGGQAAGEVASKIAIDTVMAGARRLNAATRSQIAEYWLDWLCRAADNNIFRETQRDPALAGMGTTLTLLAIRDQTANIAHVGDSQCYLVRDGVGRQLTQDHAVPGSHVLLNCLGSKPGAHIRTDIITEQVRPGDVFVLCSDGLSNMPLDHIEKAIGLYRKDLPELCECLVYHANKRDGADNITVVIVAIEAD